MPYIKTPEEIAKIKQGGKILGEILEKLAKMVKPGVSTWKIDKKAEQLIKKAGGKPSFKGYQGKKTDKPFPCAICASINDELVHGIASKEKVLKERDIFSIDIGMEFPGGRGTRDGGRGYFTDTSITVAVGKISKEAGKLINVTKQALEVGIKAVKIGGTIADIGRAIEGYVKSQGNYGIVRDLVGHGVGHGIHEEPRIPNYYDKKLESWKIQSGVVIAIEPMITMGDYHIKTSADGWSISTADGSLCAHFEHTIVVTEKGVEVATRRPNEKLI